MPNKRTQKGRSGATSKMRSTTPPVATNASQVQGSVEHLRAFEIEADAEVQGRAKLDERTVEDYVEAIKAGAKLPPVIVFRDESGTNWLADGFHRVAARARAGSKKIETVVRVGTRRDALLFAAGANAAHGLRRTHQDKRRFVLRLLNDEEWSGWSDRAIAKACAVTQPFVSSLRQTLTDNGSQSPLRRYRTKHGSEAVMDTSKIGKGRSLTTTAGPQPVANSQTAPGVFTGPFKGVPGATYRTILVVPPWTSSHTMRQRKKDAAVTDHRWTGEVDVRRVGHPEGFLVLVWAPWPELRAGYLSAAFNAWHVPWRHEFALGPEELCAIAASRPDHPFRLGSLSEVRWGGIGSNYAREALRNAASRLGKPPRLEVFAESVPSGWDGWGPTAFAAEGRVR